MVVDWSRNTCILKIHHHDVDMDALQFDRYFAKSNSARYVDN